MDSSSVTDGIGGAIIAWQDNRNGNNFTQNLDIYAQRVDSGGQVQWSANGIAICTVTKNQYFPAIINKVGGAIIIWQDGRNGGVSYNTYSQHVNATGVIQLAVNGLSVIVGTNVFRSMIPDGNGGAIITWEFSIAGGYDIYAQRINSFGVLQWGANGVAISTS